MEFRMIVTLVAFLNAFCMLSATSINKNNIVSMEMENTDTPWLSKEQVPSPKTESLFPIPSLYKHKTDVSQHESDGSKSLPHFTGKENAEFDVVIDLQQAVNTIGPRFVGVTLDSSVFRRRFQELDVYSKPLHSLVKGLAPSLFRVGGTAADFFIFNASATSVDKDYSNTTDDYPDLDYDYNSADVDNPRIENYTVTGEEWERLNYLVQYAGWDLIFDFNEFQRKGGQWDADNARELLTFSQQRNYSIPIFQLGNEPNSYYHNFHFKIPAAQLARDMQGLRALLTEFPAYKNSYIVGPDVTKVTSSSARTYLQEFLQQGGQDIVSATTLHHYYVNAHSKSTSLQDFINATILDTLKAELTIGTSISHSLAPSLPVWLSETSSVSGGGLEGVSTAYVAGFMWLDKLGLSALYGLKAVLRQCLYNGNYALISQDITPYPDYFLTLLYKRLVQGPVFNVTSSTNKVRVYANCANPSLYPKGGLVVYVLNLKTKSTSVSFPQFSDQQYALYILTPGDEHGLRSSFVSLNGQKLEMVGDELPPTPPLMHTGPVLFPAHSFGFVVIPKANIELCNNAHYK